MKNRQDKISVLMVGVGPKRVGGMWTVAEEYIKDTIYNDAVCLSYVATSTNGSKLVRLFCMLAGYVKIIWILNTKHVDIVHIHMAEKGSTFRKGLVARWARRHNKKVLIHLHAGPFMAWYATNPPSRQKTIKTIFGFADRVLVLGEYWKKELAEIIPPEKMIVLYNGVDSLEENPYDPDGKNIVYFGVMNRNKGIYDLISAIAKIDESLSDDVKVILCGNDLEGNIPETIEKAGMKERFILPGWVGGDTKEDIYRHAAINVLPSYYEGLSMTVIEAMSRGVPTVTTMISTMPELIDKSRLVEPGNVQQLADSILDLCLSKDKRIFFSNEDFKRQNSIFSSRMFISDTLEIYQSLTD